MNHILIDYRNIIYMSNYDHDDICSFKKYKHDKPAEVAVTFSQLNVHYKNCAQILQVAY